MAAARRPRRPPDDPAPDAQRALGSLDGALVRQWALQGLGLAYKARLDVLADLRAGRLVALLPQWTGETSPLHAILPDNRHVPLRVRRLIDTLVTQFAGIEGDTVALPGTDHDSAVAAAARGLLSGSLLLNLSSLC